MMRLDNTPFHNERFYTYQNYDKQVHFNCFLFFSNKYIFWLAFLTKIFVVIRCSTYLSVQSVCLINYLTRIVLNITVKVFFEDEMLHGCRHLSKLFTMKGFIFPFMLLECLPLNTSRHQLIHQRTPNYLPLMVERNHHTQSM